MYCVLVLLFDEVKLSVCKEIPVPTRLPKLGLTRGGRYVLVSDPTSPGKRPTTTLPLYKDSTRILCREEGTPHSR